MGWWKNRQQGLMIMKDKIRPGTKLVMNVGIPPTLLNFHISKSGKSLICDTAVWKPRRLTLAKMNSDEIKFVFDALEVVD